jgi:hypothetical protein
MVCQSLNLCRGKAKIDADPLLNDDLQACSVKRRDRTGALALDVIQMNHLTLFTFQFY